MKQSSSIRGVLSLTGLCTLVFLVISCAGGAFPSSRTTGPTGAAKGAATGSSLEPSASIRKPVLVKWTSFYPDGLIDQYVVYKLSSDLKLVLEEQVYDAARTEAAQKTVYDYAEGKLVRETVYEAEGVIRSRKEISYDPDWRVLSEKTYDAKGTVISSSVYAYDPTGLMSEWRALDGKGSVQAAVSYSWKNGRLTKIAMTDSSGALSGTVELDYTKDGFLAKRLYRDKSGKVEKYETYSYKGSSLVSVERHRGDGKLTMMTVYTVGDLGERLIETNYDGSGAVLGTIKYEYKVREEPGTEASSK